MKLIPQLKKVKANTCISNLPSFLSFKIIKLIWTQTLYLVRLHFNWNRLSKNFPYNSNSPWIFQISSTLGSNDISKVWANTQIPFVPGIREQYFRVCVVGGGGWQKQRETETDNKLKRKRLEFIKPFWSLQQWEIYSIYIVTQKLEVAKHREFTVLET